MKTSIQIKTDSGLVLFEHEADNNTFRRTLQEAAHKKIALDYAIIEKENIPLINLSGCDLSCANLRNTSLYNANLCCAKLINADLRETNLRSARLFSADLSSADLRGADLFGAYLNNAFLLGADLRDANLQNANFHGAYLRGAKLQGAKLQNGWGELKSDSDILTIGPVGSRHAYMTLFRTNRGIFVQCGCFKGDLEKFEAKVKSTHRGTTYEKEYLALIDFAKIKFSI